MGINIMFEKYIFEHILPLIADSVIDNEYTYKEAKNTINDCDHSLMNHYNNRRMSQDIPPGIRYPENKHEQHKGRVVRLVDEYITYHNSKDHDNNQEMFINGKFQ